MAGLELYGFYSHTVDTSNNGHLWLTKLTMDVDPATGLLPASGVYTETANSATHTEQTYMVGATNLDQIPLQQQGQMFYSRPIYGVISSTAYRNSIYWYTSLVSSSPFLKPLETTNTGALRSFDLYNYPVTTLQYHFFTLMPGKLTDNIADRSSATDYNQLKVAIIDVRTGDEVLRWPLHDCGNGVYNATAFEQCDPSASPPAPTAAPYASYVYPITGVFYNSTLGDYRKCSDHC